MNVLALYPEDRITLRELGLRDGLQMTSSWPGTVAKLEWIERACGAGVRNIEVGSFLPEARFPQFADVRQLIERVDEIPDAFSSALTLNERAVDDALATAVSEIVVVVSATEAHSRSNVNRSRESAIELLRYARAGRDANGSGPVIAAAVSVAFGCPFEGDVKPEAVMRVVDRCLGAGAEVISLADTVGVAGPRQITELLGLVTPGVGDVPVVIHLHDTRGTGIANAYAAIDAGVRVLDGTIGGLGGCPFAPGATGNVVFEDLVYLCERSGFSTGIDLARLIGIRSILEREMPGENLFGTIARAGTPESISWKA